MKKNSGTKVTFSPNIYTLSIIYIFLFFFLFFYFLHVRRKFIALHSSTFNFIPAYCLAWRPRVRSILSKIVYIIFSLNLYLYVYIDTYLLVFLKSIPLCNILVIYTGIKGILFIFQILILGFSVWIPVKEALGF